MKARNVIVMFVLVSVGTLSAEDAGIAEICREYTAINDILPSLSRAEKEISGHSTEGGKATAYQNDEGEIRLIKVELYGETGKTLREYYYRAGTLIFAYYENHRYNVPFYVTPEVAKDTGVAAFDPGKTKIAEDRFYFVEGRLVRWLDESKKEVEPASEKFNKTGGKIVEFSDEVLGMFGKKS